MTSTTCNSTASAANRTKVDQLEVALAELMRDVLQRGFYGTAGVEVAIQDGTIQHIRSRQERIEK